MAETGQGVLDTSVLIDYRLIDPDKLPDESAIAAISLAELAAGSHATGDPLERARRQSRLVWAASNWEPLPFDGATASAYGLVYSAVRATGRTSRTRFADLLIAATALANELPLYTRNPQDFAGLDGLLRIVAV